jgi:hypothetical protein
LFCSPTPHPSFWLMGMEPRASYKLGKHITEPSNCPVRCSLATRGRTPWRSTLSSFACFWILWTHRCPGSQSISDSNKVQDHECRW